MGKIYLNEEEYGSSGGDINIEFCEYVHSNNIQFDLGINSNADYQWELDFQADQYSNNMIVLGNYGVGCTFYQNQFYLGDTYVVSGFNFTARHKVIINDQNGKMWLDNEEKANYGGAYNIPMVLFGRLNATDITKFIGKLYEFKIINKTTNNALMWLKPARLISKGYIIAEGLFDIINEKWLTGNGLTAGGTIS